MRMRPHPRAPIGASACVLALLLGIPARAQQTAPSPQPAPAAQPSPEQLPPVPVVEAREKRPVKRKAAAKKKSIAASSPPGANAGAATPALPQASALAAA